MKHTFRLPIAALPLIAICAAAATAQEKESTAPQAAEVFHPPVRLEADGAPIDVGKLSEYAHAGPAHADIDGDGDRDLLVGDFPGFFWLFENAGNDREPRFLSRGQLEAGGQKAKTPVY